MSRCFAPCRRTLAPLFIALASLAGGCGGGDGVELETSAALGRLSELPRDGATPSGVPGARGLGDGPSTPALPAQPSRGDGLVVAYAGVAFALEAEPADGAAARLVARADAPDAFTYANWTLSTPRGCLAAENSEGGEVVAAPCDAANVLHFEFFVGTGYVFSAAGAAHHPWFALAAAPCRSGAGTCLQLRPSAHLVGAPLGLDAPATTAQPARGVPIYALADPGACLCDTGTDLRLAPCDPADAGQAWTLPFFASSPDGRTVRSGRGHCLDAGDALVPGLDVGCAAAATRTTAGGLSDGSLFVVVDGLGRYLGLGAGGGPVFNGAGLPPAFGFGPAPTATQR